MKQSESRLNSRMTPMIGEPFGPGGRDPLDSRFGLPVKTSLISFVGVFGCGIARVSLQKIHIDPWPSLGNHHRSNCVTIKLNRPRAANDSVNVAEFTQAPQRLYSLLRAEPRCQFPPQGLTLTRSPVRRIAFRNSESCRD